MDWNSQWMSIEAGPHFVEESAIVEFASRFDPHTCSIAMPLVADTILKVRASRSGHYGNC